MTTAPFLLGKACGDPKRYAGRRVSLRTAGGTRELGCGRLNNDAIPGRPPLLAVIVEKPPTDFRTRRGKEIARVAVYSSRGRKIVTLRRSPYFRVELYRKRYLVLASMTSASWDIEVRDLRTKKKITEDAMFGSDAVFPQFHGFWYARVELGESPPGVLCVDLRTFKRRWVLKGLPSTDDVKLAWTPSGTFHVSGKLPSGNKRWKKELRCGSAKSSPKRPTGK